VLSFAITETGSCVAQHYLSLAGVPIQVNVVDTKFTALICCKCLRLSCQQMQLCKGKHVLHRLVPV